MAEGLAEPVVVLRSPGCHVAALAAESAVEAGDVDGQAIAETAPRGCLGDLFTDECG